MANVTNLKSWQKGQSGNPSGRAKGPSLLKELLKELDQPMHRDTKVKKVQMVVSTLIDRSIAGDMAAQQLVWRYVEGNPSQPIEGDLSVTVQAVREAVKLVS